MGLVLCTQKQEGITISRVNDLWWSKDKSTGEKVKTARYGKGSRWQAVWTNRGREVKKSHRTKDAAEHWIKEQDQARLSGRRAGATKMTVAEALERYLPAQSHWQPKTRFNSEKMLRHQIVPTFGDMLLTDVGTDDVRAWVDQLRSELQPSTIRTYFSVYRAFMNWCVAEGYLVVSPTARVRLPKVVRRAQHFLTPAQFWAFQHAVDPHYRDALETNVTTGLRPGELWELRGQDVGRAPGRLRVERAVTDVDGILMVGPTKTGEARDVPVLAHVERMLKDRAQQAGPDGLLFPAEDGGQVKQSVFHEKHVTPAAVTAGLPKGFRLYDLRHTAASWAIREGASVLAVQRMLGHATPTETLNTYAHLFDDELDQVTASISKMLDRHRTATNPTDAA